MFLKVHFHYTKVYDDLCCSMDPCYSEILHRLFELYSDTECVMTIHKTSPRNAADIIYHLSLRGAYFIYKSPSIN